MRSIKRNRMVPLRSTTAMMAVSLILSFWQVSQLVDAFLFSPPTCQRSRQLSARPVSLSKTAISLVSDSIYDISSPSFDDESENVDESDLLNTMDWDVIEEDDDDDEEDAILADISEEDEATVGIPGDPEVHDIFQEWLSIWEEERSTSSTKIAVIPQLFESMDVWSAIQYNQLLELISKQGSIRDAEALLYHMIQEKECVNDESFYNVYTSYTNHEKQKRSNRKRNRQKWGTAFKLEQLLALQDALIDCTPTARTLQAVLRAMADDRTDAKVVLRARRIWDRLSTLSDGEIPVASAVSLLQACAHVPSEAAADEKLAAFTIALEVFNGITTESQSDHQPRIYVWFLRACRALLAGTAERKRDAVVEAAFRRACTAGVVTSAVRKSLSDVASDACMLRLLGGFLEDGIETPLEWSRNCDRHRSVSAPATQEVDSS